MKKVICFIVAFCMIFSAVPSLGEEYVKTAISLNGEVIPVSPDPVIEQGRTMVPAKFFRYLNCDVSVQNYFKTVVIKKGDTTILLQNGNDEYIVTNASYEQISEKIEADSWTDDEKHTFSVTPFIIEHDGFIPLKDLSTPLGYSVSWNNEERTVQVTNERARDNISVNDGTTDKITDLLDIKEAEKRGLRATDVYEAYNFDTLKKYGVIDDTNERYIKTEDAVRIIAKIACGDEMYEDWLDDWYEIDSLAPLDNIVCEEMKTVLMNLMYSYTVTTEDIVRLDYDADLTEYDALLFAIRLVGNTYGCTDTPEEILKSDYEYVYSRARQRGLIDKDTTENKDKPIPREEFYEILNRTIFTTYERGGYSGVKSIRLVDALMRRSKPETEEKISVTTKAIEPEIVWNDDLSVSWKAPEVCKEEGYFINQRVYTSEGNWIAGTGGAFCEEIPAGTIIEIVADSYPEQPGRIEIVYSKSDYDKNTRDEYAFTIDLSHIKAVRKGTPPTPGVYYRNKRQWPVTRLTVKDGAFESGKWYIIYGKDHTSRKEEYNHTSYSAFMAKKTESSVRDFGTTGTFGTSYFDEVRLIKAEFERSETGFTVYITPPSEGMFEVTEK